MALTPEQTAKIIADHGRSRATPVRRKCKLLLTANINGLSDHFKAHARITTAVAACSKW